MVRDRRIGIAPAFIRHASCEFCARRAEPEHPYRQFEGE
jgi:hypothetical protein